AGFPGVAQPASDPARSSAAHSLLTTTRSAFHPLLLAVSLGGLIVQELTDEIFQHHRRLGELERVAALQVRRVAARGDADVLLAEQPRGEYLRRAVLWKPEAVVDVHGDHGLEGLVVEPDVADATDDHAGALHRSADLQSADVLELGVHLIG